MLFIRRVVGTSMLPTYEEGQLIIAFRKFRKLRRHDIVILHHDGREKIKRVDELKPDSVYVRGDNPRHSTDSRHFGWIDQRNITGIVVWPQGTAAKQKFPK